MCVRVHAQYVWHGPIHYTLLCVHVFKPKALLTLYGSRLGGICKITDFVPLVPDSFRGHGFVLLSHSLALRALPAHCTHGHTQIKRSLHSEKSHTYSTSEPWPDAYYTCIQTLPQEKIHSTHIYQSSLHQPERKWKQMSKHRDINIVNGTFLFSMTKEIIDTKLRAVQWDNVFFYLYTSNSPPFSWHCSWQSQRTNGATYSDFRDITRSKWNKTYTATVSTKVHLLKYCT